MLGCDESGKGQLVVAASVNLRIIVGQLLSAGVLLEDEGPWTALEENFYWKHLGIKKYPHQGCGAPINSQCTVTMLAEFNIIRISLKNKTLIDHRVFNLWRKNNKY